VTLNGEVAKLGDRAGPRDVIADDAKTDRQAANTAPRVLIYNKPVGELVTREDPGGRPTVFSRLPPGRWVAVGRLDLNSSGLLLFTDSGELANRLMHPRYELEREYLARVQGLRADDLEKLRRGVDLEDGAARFDEIESQGKSEGTNRWYRVVLREGRNREVRRLFEAVGAKVSRLLRIRYGPVSLPRDLAAGQWRELAPSAVKGLSHQ
jgi:23S rRNA pseudouridine2605 synthase